RGKGGDPTIDLSATTAATQQQWPDRFFPGRMDGKRCPGVGPDPRFWCVLCSGRTSTNARVTNKRDVLERGQRWSGRYYKTWGGVT
ncbi:hypothetical protein NL676_036224, partial [Syzygium grande]